MHHQYLVALSIILLSGVLANWLGWLLGIPSILILIVSGLIVGPVTGLVQPAAIFGDLLAPLTSIAVSLILFEGGLSLNFRALRQVGSATGRICVVGPVLAWTFITLCAWTILGFELRLALLIGALLIVTGPTVIIPILREIKPNQRVATVLRWEGILTDPFGALFAVMIFEAIHGERFSTLVSSAPLTVLAALLIGSLVGAIFATIVALAIKLPWAPEALEASLTIVLVVCAYTVGDFYHKEAGLIAVTVMGLVLANQRLVPIRHIVRFKEHLVPLILSTLFIVLSAQVSLETITGVQGKQILFLVALIVVCRPASVLLSTWGTELTFRERCFISLLAPRGIVAVAVASLLGRGLMGSGIVGAEDFESTVFVVVLGTVLFSALFSRLFARLLGVTSASKGGVAIVGADSFGQQLALELHANDIPVVLIDSNPRHIRFAGSNQIEVIQGNILSESILEEVEIEGFSYLIALTSNDELNALAVLAASDFIKRDHLFRIAPDQIAGTATDPFDYIVPLNCFPSSNYTFSQLEQFLAEGGRVTTVPGTSVIEGAEAQSGTFLPLIRIGSPGEPPLFLGQAPPRSDDGSSKFIGLQLAIPAPHPG